MTNKITLQLRTPSVGTPPHEFPVYGMDTYWTEDGKVGVTVVLVREDGGVHIIQDVIQEKLERPKALT